jgi:hypothetical protein
MIEDSQTPEAAPNSRERGPTKVRAGSMRQHCPCQAHRRIRLLELATASEARADALFEAKQYAAAIEVIRVVDAIRRVA